LGADYINRIPSREYNKRFGSSNANKKVLVRMGNRYPDDRMILRTLQSFIAVLSVAGTLLLPRLMAAVQTEGAGSEMVQFPSDSSLINAYLAKPKTPGSHPAVIVIHENRGLDDQTEAIARRLTDEGFVALAPDLLSTVGGTAKFKNPEELAEAIQALPTFVAISDLKAAFEYLEKSPDVDPQKISTIGIGWGGYRSFFFTVAEPKLYRAVLFYGTAPDGGLEMIRTPILAHYAKGDNRVTGNALLLSEQLKRLGKKFDYYVYNNTDAGFFNPKGPRYNADAAKLAWSRTLDFLKAENPAPAGSQSR
jgi:carboxymethylenebutenolidase